MNEQELAQLIDQRTQTSLEKFMEENRKKYGGLHAQGVPQPGNPKKSLDPKVKFGRFIKGSIFAKGDPDKGLYFAEKCWPEDAEMKSLFEGVKAKTLTVGVPTDGGFLVPQVLADEIIPFLYAAAVIRRSGARVIDMPSGNLSIPRLNATSQFNWVGESKPAVKSQQQFGDVRLSGKKGAVLVPISNDLIRSSAASADAFITNDIVTILGLNLDYAGFYGPGTQYSPAGIQTILASQLSANQFLNPAVTLTADVLATIVGKLIQGNVPMVTPGWVISGNVWAFLFNLKTTTGAYIYRAEMETGKLLGYPFLISNQLYTTGQTLVNDFFFGDWNEFLWGEQMEIRIDTSTEASYTDGGTNNISAFDRDQTVIRALTVVDFNLRHPASFVQAQYKLS